MAKHPIEIERDEHDSNLLAKKVSLVSAATVFAVVDIAAGKSVAINSNVTLNPSPNYIGLATVTEAVPYSSPSVVIGMVSAASGALVQFPANAIKWVDVRAIYSNPTTAYLGGSNATVNNGFPLNPGDSIGMAINNTNLLYLVGVGTTEFRFLGGS